MHNRHRTLPLFAVGAAAAVLAGVVGCSPQPPAGSAPAAPPPAAPLAPFESSAHPVTAQQLGASWQPGCPVSPADLRLVELRYVGMDGTAHRGQLVVNADRVPQVVDAFAQLYGMHYPIAKMTPVEHYRDASDEASMEDNNTSAFNCRPIPGKHKWSQHAFGRAVDINPLLNPQTDAQGDVQPITATRYLDRDQNIPGLIHDGDPVVRMFTTRGWTWGGHWTDPHDYQHFEMP